MTTQIVGYYFQPGKRTPKGHRVYKLAVKVSCDPLDGPQQLLSTVGLPQPGDAYAFGNDADPWAWCRYEVDLNPSSPKAQDGDPIIQWTLGYTFSTEPVGRCQFLPIDNPLLEPMDISGGFVKYSEEATYDRFGQRVTNSAFQLMRGPQVEFDRNRPTVKIKWNVSDLQLPTLMQLVDCLNQEPLWGMPARTIKLDNVSWVRKFYGICSVYYERTLEFSGNYVYNFALKQWVSGFDRDVMDEGTKVLSGHWDGRTGGWVLDPIPGYVPPQADSPNPDPNNPTHFIAAVDRRGDKISLPLNGAGLPAGVTLLTGTRVQLVSSINLEDGTFNTEGTPANPAHVVVGVEDPSGVIEGGTITVTGEDADGNALSEQLDLSEIEAPFGEDTFTTRAFFGDVTTLTVIGLTLASPRLQLMCLGGFLAAGGVPTSVVDSTALSVGGVAITRQPVTPGGLLLSISLPDLLTAAVITVVAVDTVGQTWTWPIPYERGTGSYTFDDADIASVTSVTVTSFTYTPETPQFEAYTGTEQPAIGNVHVERYFSADFLQLGIPVDLTPGASG